MFRLAIITSHPIQYQTPLFKKISEHGEIQLTVYFREKKGALAPYYDKEFGKNVKWEIPLLEGYFFKFLSGLKHLTQELQPTSYDALIVYGWNSWLNLFACLLCRMRKIKVFIYGENPLNQEKKKRGIAQAIKRKVLCLLFQQMSACLFIGKENKKFYEWLGVSKKKLFYVPYAVDNARFREANIRLLEIRSPLEIGSQGGEHQNKNITILFVGKLIARKRPLDLIRAFAPFDAKSQLVMVGEGSLKRELEEYVQKNKIKNVRFAGFVNQETLSTYYREADVFVLPSGRGETWGLVVNEAMNFSLPIIGSDSVGCAADFVRQGINGFTYPEGDIKKLSEHIKMLVGNENTRKSFGKESEMLVRHFSYEKDIEGIIQALSSC